MEESGLLLLLGFVLNFRLWILAAFSAPFSDLFRVISLCCHLNSCSMCLEDYFGRVISDKCCFYKGFPTKQFWDGLLVPLGIL